jgi:hypothetical protein
VGSVDLVALIEADERGGRKSGIGFDMRLTKIIMWMVVLLIATGTAIFLWTLGVDVHWPIFSK